MKFKLIILLFLPIVIFIGIFIYQNYRSRTRTSETSSEINDNYRFTGSIVEVDDSCSYDGICRVKVDNIWITTNLGGDPSPEMETQRGPRGSITLTNGQKTSNFPQEYIGKNVDVYAKQIDETTATLYGSEKYYIKVNNASTYSATPLEECVVCMQGKSWNNNPCCIDNFDTNCSEKNGVVRKFDLHPAFNSVKKGCFQKAPDAGKECAEDKECLSGICNLENAIQSKRCTLTKKESTGEKNFFSGADLYTTTYSCDNPRPGICTEAIKDGLNSDGIATIFKMNGQTLIETQYSEPIR